MGRVYIGVAWPYANAHIHIGGFAGVYLPADATARFHRLRGDEVLMVSGSDVHGTPILVAAEEQGVSPEALSQRYHAENAAVLQKLGISFDLFTHTHTAVHARTVQELFLSLLEAGLVTRRSEENPFCPKHQRFLPDRYVLGICPNCASPNARGDECDNCGRVLEPKELGSPRCRLCGTPAEFRVTEHFALRLDLLAPKIDAYLRPQESWRPSVRNTAANFLASGLHPTPITRDLDWGVPIPLEGYGTKRFYVWFDAVIGYLSASREWAIRSGNPDAWKRFWDPAQPAKALYFLGKDNIFHHTILWPGILLGHGRLRLPTDVPANEWMQIHGRKISKSRPDDVGAFLPELAQRYPPDVLRFYAALLAPENHDTEYDPEELRQQADEVLSNQYGNLAQRVLVLLRDRARGRIPEPSGDAARTERLRAHLAEVHAGVDADLERTHLKEAFDRILGEVRDANRWFHEARPWQLPEKERDAVLFEAAWRLRALAIWLSPFLPFSSEQLYRSLGFDRGPSAGDWASALHPVPPGQRLGPVTPLFPRLEPAKPPAPLPDAATEPAIPPASVPAAAPAAAAAWDVRVGAILQAEPHPAADRLYVLTVDVGEAKPRTVVAGLRNSYSVPELVGRSVAVLANLEPRAIRKVTSQGMVLAADAGEKAVLLRPPKDAPAGTPLADGPAGPAASLRYDEFERTPLVVGTVTGTAGDGTQVDVGGRSVVVGDRWTPGRSVIVRLTAPSSDRGQVLSFGSYGAADTDPALPAGTRVR